jgi:SAM-dependent methyltransferase
MEVITELCDRLGVVRSPSTWTLPTWRSTAARSAAGRITTRASGPAVRDLLRTKVPRVTAIEIDPRLADALRQRTLGQGVEVVTGDATAMPFQAARFSAVVSFTMLHHIPSPQSQDRLLAEACRVLRPGGVFAGSDSTASFLFRLAHLGDTMMLVDPDRFATRLQAAGFTDARVRRGHRAFAFRAIRPPMPLGT